MAADYVSLTAGDLSLDAAYDLLTAAISPRPIALVSTIDAKGDPNLAPFSFFMAGGVSPLSLAFSPTDGSSGPKHTLMNILETEEFVVNTVHGAMAAGMNAASYGFQNSEWDASGFMRVPSIDVRPPRVGESLVQMECRLFQVIRHGNGSGAANYVIGEVLRLHLHQEIAPGSLRLLSRLGGPSYLDAKSLTVFEMQRPTAPVPEET